jgi:hypothetical protein
MSTEDAATEPGRDADEIRSLSLLNSRIRNDFSADDKLIQKTWKTVIVDLFILRFSRQKYRQQNYPIPDVSADTVIIISCGA